jgi:hypothetical protein
MLKIFISVLIIAKNMQFKRNMNPKISLKLGIDANLKASGLEFTNTALGAGVFIPIGAKDAMNGLFPRDWTVKQLRAMADYMEANPNCTIFDDGSGEPVRME